MKFLKKMILKPLRWIFHKIEKKIPMDWGSDDNML